MQKVKFLPSDFPEKDSFSCLFLICQLHIIAELVHHLHEGLIHDLLPALGDAVHIGKGYSDLLRDLRLGGAALDQLCFQPFQTSLSFYVLVNRQSRPRTRRLHRCPFSRAYITFYLQDHIHYFLTSKTVARPNI